MNAVLHHEYIVLQNIYIYIWIRKLKMQGVI